MGLQLTWWVWVKEKASALQFLDTTKRAEIWDRQSAYIASET